MSNLKWKINRIQAMSFREILFRFKRGIEVSRERKRVLSGWIPKIDGKFEVRGELFQFSLEEILSQYAETYGKDNSVDVEKLLREFYIFSNYRIDITSPIDWSTDPETGITAPQIFGKDIDYRNEKLVGNCKTLWEISRHNYLVPMAAAYALTGDTRLYDKVMDQIESWIDENPYGKGVHWCSSLEVSIRLISWCFVHGLISLRKSEGLFENTDMKSKLQESIFQHAYFIIHYLSRYSSANNHLIGELTGVWVACNLFELGSSGRIWREQVKSELIREASLQVFDDGVSKEQATYYHLWVSEYLLLNYIIGERFGNGFDAVFAGRISKMGQFLSDIKPKGCDTPQVGDADDGLVVYFEEREKDTPYASFLSALQDDRDLTNKSISKKAFWYSCIDENHTKLKKGASQDVIGESGLKVYQDGGYVIFSDDDLHLVFDSGTLGYPSIAAHGHADALSIILSAYDKWWLVDVGTYCYHTDPLWRNYFRGTSAHNTIAFDDQDQSLIGGDFLWLKHGDCKLEASQSLDDDTVHMKGRAVPYHSSKVSHTRDLYVNSKSKTLTIEDGISIEKDTKTDIFFHFHPDVTPALDEKNNTCVLSHKSLDKQIKFDLDKSVDWSVVKGRENPPLGWYSEKLGEKEESSVLVGSTVLNKSETIVSSIKWE